MTALLIFMSLHGMSLHGLALLAQTPSMLLAQSPAPAAAPSRATLLGQSPNATLGQSLSAPQAQSPNVPQAQSPDELPAQLLGLKRVFVDRLTGGETAAQMRDLLISSLQGARLFILTENADRADAFLRGASEDLIYTDAFQSSEGINAHVGDSDNSSVGTSTRFNGAGGGASRSAGRSLNMGIGENESSSVKERKHEALATVRIVNKDGDVIWSTTQESNGAKFRGASADVADKITRQLAIDVDKLRRTGPNPKN
jgi:hypothetical protein